jgi:DNA helicase-2/ATP-dependent DNA helicase PcrA
MALVRHWYQPHVERLHDNVGARAGDLDRPEQITGTYLTRGSFSQRTDPSIRPRPPAPRRSRRAYLVLSTIHSAKGQERDAVFALKLIDGCIPSDMMVGSPKQTVR